MTRHFRTHQILAIVVLAATAVWVLTGDFARLGSDAVAEAPREAASAPAPGSSLRKVRIASPELRDYARQIRVSGVTEADKISVLAARTSGIIRDLAVEDGTVVVTGDVLMSLDGPEKFAAVETGQALVAQRKAQSDAAEALAKTGEGARIAADTARADLAAAQAQLREAQSEVEQLDVIAPFDGVVDDVSAEQGSWVQLGAEVATILSLDPLVVRGEISERERGAVRPGTPASVRLATGAEIGGQVRRVRNQASETTRTFQIEVEIPNPDAGIPAGMTAEILLRAAEVPVAMVPRSVVTLGSDGAVGVRIVGPDDVVGFLPVVLVDDTPDGLAISGVPAGTRIIVAGQDLVSEGDRVVPVTDEGGAAAGEAPVTAADKDRAPDGGKL